MKKIILSITTLIVAISISTVSFAQISEAEITYDVTMHSDDPVVQKEMAMMSGSSIKMSFKGENFRTDTDMRIMNTAVIADGKKEGGLMLINSMGMNWAIPMSKTDLDKQKGEIEAQYVYMTDETKEILGYKCKKVVVTDKDGIEILMYVTEDIAPANNQNKYGSRIKGFPLMIESKQNQGEKEMTTTIIATTVIKKITDTKIFSTEIPDGYDVKSMDDLESIYSGM